MTINIRTRATWLLTEKRAKDAKQRERDEDYHRYLIRERLHQLLDLVIAKDEGEPHGPYLELDGLLFAHPDDLRLVYRCIACDAQLLSLPIRTGVVLGELLEEPQLDPSGGVCIAGSKHTPIHWCEPKPPSVRGDRGRRLEI